MKQLLLIAALILLAMPAGASESESTPERRTKTFTVQKGGDLDVSVSGGDIRLVPWGKNELTVTAEGIDDGDLDDLSMTQEGQTVTISFRPRWGSSGDVRFTVNLPSQFNVRAHTSGGDIAVDGAISGTLSGSTSGGDIRTGAIEGPTTLKTSGGDITLGRINGKTEVKTSGGDIRIESVSKDLSASTSGGDVQVGDIGGEAQLKTSGGDVRVGKVTGKASLRTSGGNIELQGASGATDVMTAGGNIRLNNLTGSITAKTAGGNIDAEINGTRGGRSDLKTAAGNVVVSIGADVKATIEAAISLRGSRRNAKSGGFAIHSDFTAEPAQSEKDGGEIREVYRINGGGERITIMTSEGNIEIRKK
ncbi:MAG: DUF4097 family beta strand repeat-containing protein [Acidobacteriota bacterium]